jgi:hypothetical protein
MRVFFAHPKSMDEAETAAWIADAAALFDDEGLGEATFVSGRDDYFQYAASAGGWKSWALDVVARIDMSTRQPFYDAILVPGRTIGAATQAVVSSAMGQGRPVLVMTRAVADENKPAKIERAVEIVVDDPEDYTTGWWIDT